jgi:hypothetical protein
MRIASSKESAMTTLPPHERVVPIDTFAGVATQFERNDGGYLFRRGGCGPAVRVSVAERDAFTQRARWSVAIHAVALGICGYAGWLGASRILGAGGEIVVAIGFGIVLSLIALVLYGSLRWNADGPGRAFAGRPVERPACDPDFRDRPGYGMILGTTLALLVLAAMGTQQPAGFYVTFATVAVMAGLFLAVRKIWFDSGLTPEQRRRAKAVARQEADDARPRRNGKPVSGWIGLLQLFLALFQIAAIFGGFVLGMGIVTEIAGTTADTASGPGLWIAIGAGVIVAGLFGWGVERLCKRWTGESALGTFDFIPPGW